MFRTRHLLVSVSVVLVTAALSAGCSEKTQATPRVTFFSSISRGKHSSAECTQSASPWFTIGSFGNPALGAEDPLKPVRPVDDGADEQQGKAVVNCSVVEAADGFDVAVHAELTGATGGAMTLTGKVKRGEPSSGVAFALTRKGETYKSNSGCTVTFDPNAGHAVAPGRVWAKIECPDSEAPSQQRVCTTDAEFRFENCSQ